ncbi:MAG: dephospho-CoA kinase [Ectothiorhodospiraceae bacterium]|nr:dephospho-CoA kinase [Ectothiorhodospiraceae bacterium]
MSRYIIGLTGGIGSGKSTVAAGFAARGITIVDTDVIARELVAPGSAALGEIAAAFGREHLNPDGSLNRASLRQRVFQDDAARKRLEAILHPRIRGITAERLAAAAGPYAIAVIPLLIESGLGDMVDRVLVVDCPEATQLARVTARDALDAGTVRRIMAAQVGRAERLRHADDVILNENGPEALARQIEVLDRHYRELAGEV